jgi:hypothetical protein
VRLILLLTSLITLVISYAAPAQVYQYWEIGVMGGVTLYHGDLAPDFSFQSPGLATTIFVRHNIDSRLSLRVAASFAIISADDSKSENPYRKARNLNFKSNIFEGSVGVEFNFVPFHHKSRKNGRNQFTPYLLVGLGVFYHNPETEYNGKIYELQPLGTEGQARGKEYSLVQPAFIIGGGFKFDFNKKWGIIIAGSTRILFFDYLDDVSNQYAAPQVILAHRGSMGSTAVQLADRYREINQDLGNEERQRGNTNNNDGYTLFSVGIVYTMYQAECPSY